MKYRRCLPLLLGLLLFTTPTMAILSCAAPPSPPLDLTCTVGETYVDLSWKPPEDGNLSHYLVYGGRSFDTMKVIANVSANQTAYHHGGLSVGTTNYYVVTAVGPEGESAVSNAVVATTESNVIIKTSPSSNEMWISIIALVLGVVAIQISVIAIWVLVKKTFR